MKTVCFILIGCLLPAAFGNILDDLKAAGFTKLVELVEQTGLEDSIVEAEPLTLFAPTNEALYAVPHKLPIEDLKILLLYHVIGNRFLPIEQILPVERITTAANSILTVNKYEDDVITANGRVLTKFNIDIGENSIAHEVGEVLQYITPNDNIFITLWKQGTFNTLIKAIKAGSVEDGRSGTLEQALQNNEFKLSVVAPTDQAFAKLPKETLENLLKPENIEELKAFLKTHAVPQIYYKAGLENDKEYQTMDDKSKVKIHISDGVVSVNKVGSLTSATVVKANVAATNGVVYAIDEVLL